MRRLALWAFCSLAWGCASGPEVSHREEVTDASEEATAPTSFRNLIEGLPEHTIVLTYHDVIERRDSKSVWFDTTQKELEGQIEWLKSEGAYFISVEDLYGRLTEGKELPRGSVLITFADNYLGFYKLALPILRREKIPTVMFVHTGFVGSKVGRPKMSWNQLLELDREGLVTIASQTVTHPADLRTLTEVELATEMVDSKKALEEKLGHSVDLIAYPNGKFDDRAITAAKDAGYRMAFSEVQEPAEASPGILAVNRWVHTKYRDAWRSVAPKR